MHLIDLDKAKPGMTLAKSVSTLQDRAAAETGCPVDRKKYPYLEIMGHSRNLD